MNLQDNQTYESQVRRNAISHIVELNPGNCDRAELEGCSLKALGQMLAKSACGYSAQHEEGVQRPILQKRYSILATARSGSTFFSELLQSLKVFGKPKEYIRSPHVFLAQNAAVLEIDYREFLDEIAYCNAVEGVFGAKHIDDFFLPAFKASGALKNKELAKAFLGDRVILYRRADQIAQAVSKFIAEEIKVWHIRDSDKRDRYEKKLDRVAFDYSKIEFHLNVIRQGERQFATIVEETGLPCLELSYEDVMENPQQNVSRVAYFLDIDTSDLSMVMHSRVQQLHSLKATQFAERFLNESRILRDNPNS